MRFRARQNGPAVAARGVARAAVAGIARHELIQEAVHILLAHGKADRIGVWMESADSEHVPGRRFAEFRGIVADRDGEATPPEWERLSPEAPLPVELLNAGKSAEQDLGGARNHIVFGALLEIKRALWVPVEIRGRLRGVLLAGSHKKRGALPLRLLESVSAELALVVERDEQRWRAQQRQADITVTRHFLEELVSAGASDAVLARLVESCTDSGLEGEGLGAAFAVLRAHPDAAGISGPAPRARLIASHARVPESLSDMSAPVEPQANHRRALSWQSGDVPWLQSLDSQYLEGIWQQARKAQITVVVRTRSGTPWPHGEVSRVVVIGLEAAGETIGVLAAGFRDDRASQGAIERLESRAALATTALVLREREDETARHEARETKLLHTEKLAALGQMVTGVAHELSNPLTSILGYAQRLFLRSQAEGKSDEVRQIFQEAERASMIVRRLLISARESRPERRRIALNLLVLRAMDLQKIRLASEKVNVALDLDEALPFVLGDAGQLQQVLMNLIGNARQAIEQRGNGGTIRLSTKCIDSGRHAQLEVSDDGPGIPPEIASRIFDPFFTTKPAGIGTGLGLAIVHGVVREHGGRVMVASPPGGGAIFTLEFPAAPAEHTRMPAVPATGPGVLNHEIVPAGPVPALPPRSTPAAAPTLASWKGTRVLVVEDEPTVARLISDVLEDEGFRVEALLDGYEALERAARASYDLVICDMKMPGLDGQHFYDTLACMGNPLSKRFLFVTGDVLSSHTQEFLERHHLPHVAKPFRVEELTEKVRRVLAEIRPDEPSSEPAARTNAAST
jgi:signal transduction histidine kinase/ActR/RegA family two-component response regulator